MSAAPSALRSARLLLVLLGLPLATVLAGAPVQAAERVVTVTAEGVEPEVLEVDPGDTVRIVVRDRTFAYRAQSTGGAWRFDSGPVALLRGDFVVPGPVRAPGTYTYRVAQDAPYRGTVVVRGPDGAAPSPAPTPSPAAGAPVPAPATAAPAPLAAPAVPGVLPGARTSRGLGLPVALATVLLLGATSLLARLLLALPPGHRSS